MSASERVQETPAASASLPNGGLSRAQALLVDFLSDNDAACPVCDYNLKALTRPVCPECKHHLVLTVGAARPRMGWLLAAVAPGFFSGISAIFVLVPILGRVVFGDGVWTLPLVALDLFGWCSGVSAILIARRRFRFIAQPRERQRWQALIIWCIHITALLMFLLLAYLFG